MRKQIISIACMAVMLFFASQAAFAGDAGKVGLGLRVGYAGYAGDTVDGVKLDPGGAAFYGANLTYFFAKDWAVEGAVEYCKAQVDAKASGVTQDIGDLTQIPILLTVRYQPTVGAWMPYVGLGTGYYINDLSAKDSKDDPNLEDKFGFLVNCGTEYMVNANNSLGLDLRYTWNSTKDKDTAGSPSFDLNAFQASFGWKYYF